MTEPAVRQPLDLGTSLAGVALPFSAMNAPGVRSRTAAELMALARSGTGAVVLRTLTVHPFMHPEYRALHNPGYDRFLGLVPELVAVGPPVFASIAGSAVGELVTLAEAFAGAGCALVELNLADPWVEATLAPFEDLDALGVVLRAVTAACPVPVGVRLPARRLPYRALGAVFADAGVRMIAASNDFAGLERLRLESEHPIDVVAVGGVRSGYDVARARAKGARAVEVRGMLAEEGVRVFARLAREMRRRTD